jgi:hypothetical protein
MSNERKHPPSPQPSAALQVFPCPTGGEGEGPRRALTRGEGENRRPAPSRGAERVIIRESQESKQSLNPLDWKAPMLGTSPLSLDWKAPLLGTSPLSLDGRGAGERVRQ